ncbi:glutathione S-transferase [Halodurantibacterium flavum]|uniref:Glutathione S-transferase n=1 Tax=Halodurantibacterium flavum TaxID=1382802 RepID=A0ABW4S6L4_9RHOB
MKLYHSATSPFARKVVVVLMETGQAGAVTLVPGSGTPVDPGNQPLAHNPLGKIPTLVRDDGPALYDSRVICRYLDARAGRRLYPEGAREWDALVLESTADGMMDAALLMVYETRVRPEEARLPAWVEGQWTKIARALDTLEARWISHLNGPLDIGQIAVACALGYLDLRHGERGWRTGRPALAEWFATFSQRPSMTATRADQ